MQVFTTDKMLGMEQDMTSSHFINHDDYLFYKDILEKKSGYFLPLDKHYLLLARLSPIALSLGYPSLSSLTSSLRKSQKESDINAVAEAMTTNETSFFRDVKPFHDFRYSILPHIVNENKQDKLIRIWSAACSTGQEAYSLAMIMEDFIQDHSGWDYHITGTDISEKVLKKSQSGEYSQFDIQRGVPAGMIAKYFKNTGRSWKIIDKIKYKTDFKILNLLEKNWNIGSFDVVFCRNVMIYFTPDIKKSVMCNIAHHISKNGFIALGGCETIVGLDVPFSNVKNIQGFFYRNSQLLQAGEK